MKVLLYIFFFIGVTCFPQRQNNTGEYYIESKLMQWDKNKNPLRFTSVLWQGVSPAEVQKIFSLPEEVYSNNRFLQLYVNNYTRLTSVKPKDINAISVYDFTESIQHKYFIKVNGEFILSPQYTTKFTQPIKCEWYEKLFMVETLAKNADNNPALIIIHANNSSNKKHNELADSLRSFIASYAPVKENKKYKKLRAAYNNSFIDKIELVQTDTIFILKK